MSGERTLTPQLPIPLLRTANLARTTAWYREVLGWRMVQRVPGVVATMRLGGAEFQLWQVPELETPQCCCIVLDGRRANLFDCHAQLARTARAWIAASPALQPWGAWEFGVVDCDGNCLRFVQWASGPLPTLTLHETPKRPGRGSRDRMGG